MVDATTVSRAEAGAPPMEPGDSFLLFSSLPGHFLPEDLPLAVGPDVYLEKTPVEVLDRADPSAFADFVLPGYHVDWSFWSEYCLRCPRADNRASTRDAGNLLFNSVAGLRLRLPARICIEGKFDLGHSHEIKNAALFHLQSPWSSESRSYYLLDDVAWAADIAKRQLELWERGYKRIVTATLRFLQVTCGFSVSYQMSYLGLFSALEALLVPHGQDKHATLAHRAAQFLALPETLQDWLENEYARGRNLLAHGVDDAMPWSKLREDHRVLFGALHELTRLCILGFMCMGDDELETLSMRSVSRVQTRLTSLPPAAGRFIHGQQAWKERLVRDVEQWLGGDGYGLHDSSV